MEKQTQQDTKSIYTKIDATRRYMNDAGTVAASFPAPAIHESVPFGDDQGGLFDWFKRLFGFGKKNDTEETHDTPVTDTEQEASAWDTPADEADYVVTKPNENEGKAVYNLEKNYKGEDIKTRPVFETHSFMPREEIDEQSAWYLHSFMGLRYTKLNPKTGRFERKRAKIGYGGHGFMDDTHTQADISTETAITVNTFDSVIASVDQAARNIDAKKQGGKDSGGFSGTYNVITNNCNDFVEYMARIAGATVPATLHHSILGPAGAYKQLAQAAEQGSQGDTRFFQGGGKSLGQMSKANRTTFLLTYQSEALRALAVDGIKPEDNATFTDLINQLVTNAVMLSQYIPGSGSNVTVGEDDLPALADFLDDVTASVRAVVQFHHKKSHPRLNISALKVEALANLVRNTYFPQKRGIEDMTQTELVTSLQNPTTAEKLANRQKSFTLTNDALYGKNGASEMKNLDSGDSQRLPASMLLLAVGIDDPVEYVKVANAKRSTRVADMFMVNDLADRLAAGADRLRPLLKMYLDVRKGNSSRQCATLLTSGILDNVVLRTLSGVMIDTAALRDKDTGEASEEDKKSIADIERKFYDKSGKGDKASKGMQMVMNDYKTQIAGARRIEATLLEQIEAIRTAEE